MSEKISMEEKLKIAHQFILESPPGELNDVFNGQNLSSEFQNYQYLV